jgi:hypothetical protein
MKKLCIVGKGYHTEEDVVDYYNTGDRMKKWGKLGAFWGGLWGLLFGSAFFSSLVLAPLWPEALWSLPSWEAWRELLLSVA